MANRTFDGLEDVDVDVDVVDALTVAVADAGFRSTCGRIAATANPFNNRFASGEVSGFLNMEVSSAAALLPCKIFLILVFSGRDESFTACKAAVPSLVTAWPNFATAFASAAEYAACSCSSFWSLAVIALTNCLSASNSTSFILSSPFGAKAPFSAAALSIASAPIGKSIFSVLPSKDFTSTMAPPPRKLPFFLMTTAKIPPAVATPTMAARVAHTPGPMSTPPPVVVQLLKSGALLKIVSAYIGNFGKGPFTLSNTPLALLTTPLAMASFASFMT